MNHPARTDREWMELITACRTSGLNDKDWCERNGIPISNDAELEKLAPWNSGLKSTIKEIEQNSIM